MGNFSLRQGLVEGHLKYTEVTEEVGPTIKGSVTGGHVHPDVRDFLPGGGSGCPNIRIKFVGDVSTHWEGARRISPPGDTPTDRAASKTEGGRDLVLTFTDNGDGRGGLEGYGDIRLPPPDHRHTVHHDKTHHGSVSGDVASP